MYRIFIIFFVVAVALLFLRLCVPGLLLGIFAPHEDWNIVEGIKIAIEKCGHYKIYSWFFFVLMFFFAFMILYVIGQFPTFNDFAVFMYGGEEEIGIPFFISLFFAFYVLMSAQGVRLFFFLKLPPFIPFVIMELIWIALIFGTGVEISGNMIIDSLVISTGAILLSLFFTLGLKVGFLLVFSDFPVTTYLILFATSFLIFRIIFWVLKG